MSFSNFTFYQLNGGRLTKEAYNSVIHRAYAEILSQTNGTALTAWERMSIPIQLCECELVDVFHSYDESSNLIPKGISSVTNDSYSISRNATASDEKTEIHKICSKYLQYPVNLMCRWV